jgi:RNA polymerase sigma-70 factor (ECF subfamily)
MSDGDEVTKLIGLLNAGNTEAANRLFAIYVHRLSRLAQQHLSRKMAGRLDGEDVVQSVFRTFFRRSVRGEFQIDSSAKIWRLLVKITLMKARAKGRYHTAEKRDVRSETLPSEDAGWLQVLAREPGPAEAAAFVDLMESLLHERPPLFREVLQLRLEGQGATAIAKQLGISRQNVYQILKQLQARLLDFDASAQK